MKSLLIRFSTALGGSLVISAVAFTGMAGASSISNTGPGSVNVISGSSSGSIDTTGPHSVNVIGSGTKHVKHCDWWNWCCRCPKA